VACPPVLRARRRHCSASDQWHPHIFVPAVGLSQARRTALAAHGFGGNVLLLQNVLNASIAQLRVAPKTIGGSADRTYEEGLKTIFDTINNQNIFAV